MRSNDVARMHVVKKEEKEGKLKEFIARDIALRAGSPYSAPVRYRLIALSFESPVAKALASLVLEASHAGIEIEAVFAKSTDVTGNSDASESFLKLAATCRVTHDSRLLDAHEQLVLGASTAWIGDCMRRDPAKRDAYECYAEHCPETAEWAARSFDRLWTSAEPVVLTSSAPQPDLPALAPEMADAALALQQDGTSVSAATRH